MIDLSNIDTVTPTEYSRYMYIDKILREVLKGKVNTACDIGCGTGKLLSALKRSGISVKGIDVSEESIRIAGNRIKNSAISLEKKDVFNLNERFDLVYLTEVLEHIKRDAELLAFLRNKAVKKSGFLILTVPAHTFLYSNFDRNVGHFRRYDKKALISLLDRCGFKTLIFWSYGSLLFHIIANLSIASKKEAFTTGGKPDDFRGKTEKSAIREFSPFLRFFVSRVNIMHYFFFFLDYLFRNRDMGIEYCLLCKSY